MGKSQSISVRVPNELLEVLDRIAASRYPLRNNKPNRSKTILDLIALGVTQQLLSPQNGQPKSQTALLHKSKGESQQVRQLSDKELSELVKREVANQLQQQLQRLEEISSDNSPPSQTTTPNGQDVPESSLESKQTERPATQKSDRIRTGIRSGRMTKFYASPGLAQSEGQGIRHVEIETADDLLVEIRWCLGVGGDFVFLRERGNFDQIVGYYLRAPHYWQGRRQVKTALVRELIKLQAIGTCDNSKSICRRFYLLISLEEAFLARGGNPNDPNSTIKNRKGDRPVKLSTLGNKTNTQLQAYGIGVDPNLEHKGKPAYYLQPD